MQKLPLDEQDFVHIRERNLLYVDKTEPIYHLMNAGGQHILSRPRGFGKSLLISTLREIYRGNRSLFQGLWIEDKIDWQPRPVIEIDFNVVNYYTQSLARGLANYMDTLADKYGITLATENCADKLREFIRQQASAGKVILLINGYDRPIFDLMESRQRMREHAATLRDLFFVLRESEGKQIDFTLITCTSRYSRDAIFSTEATIYASETPRTAPIIGYTQAELLQYFRGYIDRLSAKLGRDKTEILEQIAYWYGGYSIDRISRIDRIYAPYSIHRLFDEQFFANYRYDSRQIESLVRQLGQEQVPASDLEGEGMALVGLQSTAIDSYRAGALLVHSGYLTFKHFRARSTVPHSTFAYPNYEVAHTFRQHLLAHYLGCSIEWIGESLLVDFKQALNSQDYKRFVTLLESAFALARDELFLPAGQFYWSIYILILMLLDFTILDSMDFPVRIERKTVYLFAFNMQENRMDSQGWNAEFQWLSDSDLLPRDKTTIFLGINFDSGLGTIVDWQKYIYLPSK